MWSAMLLHDASLRLTASSPASLVYSKHSVSRPHSTAVVTSPKFPLKHHRVAESQENWHGEYRNIWVDTFNSYCLV